MQQHPGRFHPISSLQKLLQKQYQNRLRQIEQNLEQQATSLPAIAPWTQHLTQVLLLGIAIGAGWSVLARVDVVVNAEGKLEPVSQSQVIQAKSGGTVTAVLVQEGDPVEQGQLLLQLDKTALYNQLQALLMQRKQLVEETAVLRLSRQNQSLATLQEHAPQLSPELVSRIQTRMLLVAKMTGDPSGLDAEQRQRYVLFQQQLRDRQSINQLSNSGLQAQISAIDTQLAQTNFQLGVEQELLTRLQPLLDEGAISRTDYLRRVVDVNALQNQSNQHQLQKRQLEISRVQTDVAASSLETDIQQELQRQLATLDADFDATIKENQRQLIQITAQINQIETDLKNQDLRAPIDGVVFDLGPKLPGVVTQSGQTLLNVVPDEALIVRVNVLNSDIANIRVGMSVDVRVSAYPFTEYGSIPGTVTQIGSEALSLEGQGQQTVFPVEVRLDQQFLERGNQRFSLNPGMSAVALIRVRQRAPISYVTEELIKAFDGMRTVR